MNTIGRYTENRETTMYVQEGDKDAKNSNEIVRSADDVQFSSCVVVSAGAGGREDIF